MSQRRSQFQVSDYAYRYNTEMHKWSGIFDRKHERDALDRFTNRGAPGATLGLVYGRRRQGKTILLQALSEATGGFYHSALEQSSRQNLRHLGEALGRYRGLATPLTIDNWADAVDALLALGEADHPLPVVVDEFPYLVDRAPELASILQSALSPRGRARRESNARLILCGSAFSVMRGLLGGSAALRGRAVMEQIVNPFAYRTAAAFWNITKPWELAFKVNALLGGTPAYRDFCNDDMPTTIRDFDHWVSRTILNPASALFREGRVLVATEPQIGDANLYLSILAAISNGNTRTSQIGAALGRSETSLSRQFAVLEEIQLISRLPDPLRQRRSTHRIAEPMLRTHQLIIGRHEARLLRHQAETVWREAQPTITNNIYGPHFEDLAREWTISCASAETLGAAAQQVGRTEVACREHRINHEVDVVVVTEGRVLAIGEAKLHKVGSDQVARLRHVAELLPGGTDARLLVFSGSGFDKETIAFAQTDSRVQLVDFERLYAGS